VAWHQALGSQIPGVITAGQFYQHGQRVFWDVHEPANSIIIELHDDRYGQLIVEVIDPLAAVEQIKANLRE
jgi:hypothetical protein